MSRKISQNPFFQNEQVENFPPLTQSQVFQQPDMDNDEQQQDDDDMQFEDFNSSTVDYSIDTLAKVKPVDISNMTEFFRNKDAEEQMEAEMEQDMAKEDADYFLHKEEELSPQHHASVNLSIATQTSLTISPTIV